GGVGGGGRLAGGEGEAEEQGEGGGQDALGHEAKITVFLRFWNSLSRAAPSGRSGHLPIAERRGGKRISSPPCGEVSAKPTEGATPAGAVTPHPPAAG